MQSYIEQLEKKEKMRILYAAKSEDGHNINYLFVRDEKEYLSFQPKAEQVETEIDGIHLCGTDLRVCLAGWLKGEGILTDGAGEIIRQTTVWDYICEVLDVDVMERTPETADELFWQVITGKVSYEIINSRSRMSDFIYEVIPDAEIEIENQFGEHLYIYGYKARAYEAYGIMDISWLDHDFDSGEIDRESHTICAYDSFLDSLSSPYAAVFLEVQELLYQALAEADVSPDGEEMEDTEEMPYMTGMYYADYE